MGAAQAQILRHIINAFPISLAVSGENSAQCFSGPFLAMKAIAGCAGQRWNFVCGDTCLLMKIRLMKTKLMKTKMRDLN